MTDLRQQLHETLGAAYTLERELAGGGMSRVFVAMDAALQRRVVVKVLSPDLAQGISLERFAREIKVAAALQDPHIVPVHSAGESGGLPYYTMPFVEGESLRARLLRGPVPVNEAIHILRDVALALEYAHAHGVVHRDIKPENVLLAGRTAVVADFGIAKAVSAARTGEPQVRDGTLTSIGQSLGTPAYMAPEQVAGEAIDHRSDLYAWGVMAYEVLAGRHPFADKASASQLMAAHLSEVPRSLIDTTPGIPVPVAALVMKCLEKTPGQRPTGASEVVAALDAIHTPSAATTTTAATKAPARRVPLAASLGLAAAGLVAATVFLLQRNGATTSPDGSNALSIAVLPFENLGDSSDAYFADGMTDAVRGKLTQVPGVAVIARGSSDQYRRTAKMPQDIARELGVHYLLTGKVRFAGSGDARRVQVSPELVEIRDGQPQTRWQEPFDSETKDVFQVQGVIAGRVAEAMRVALGRGTQQQLEEALTQDPAAYDAFLRGEAVVTASTDPASLRRAISFFEQAVRLDSAMVDAWGALSRASSSLYVNGTPTPQIRQRALDAARKALELQPTGAAGHRAMGQYHVSVNNDYLAALEELELARQASPTSSAILSNIANAKSELGRFDEAMRDREAALRIDPRNAGLWRGQSQTLLRLRRLTEARTAAERAFALSPTNMNSLLTRVLTEAASGDLEAARRVIVATVRELPQAHVLSQVAWYWDLYWTFDTTMARQLLVIGPEGYDGDRSGWSAVRAQMYHQLGDASRARAWGDTAAKYFAANTRATPNDPQQYMFLGLAHAHGGRMKESMDASRRGLDLARPDSTTIWGLNTAYFTYVGARTALVAGDKTKAIELLGESMRLRYFVTPQWLRVDPTWNALRGDPRFERLLSGT